MPDYPPTAGDWIAVAALIVGFAVTVIMFRVQRELFVEDRHPKWPNWLAWSDYLIMLSVVLAVLALVVLLAIPQITPHRRAFAAASCVAAIILQAGYIPGILAHYRIEIGRHRTGDREKGEPAEKIIVYMTILFAAAVFSFAFHEHFTSSVGPSLKETLGYLQQSLASHSGQRIEKSPLSPEVKLVKRLSADGCDLRYEISQSDVIQVALGDIDTETVEVKLIGDSWWAVFTTRNFNKSVHYTHPKDPSLDYSAEVGGFSLDQEQRARSFAKAITHAAQLCGATTSSF